MRTAALAFAGVLLTGEAALAATPITTPLCIAKKAKEWGKLRSCEAAERAKAIRGLPSNAARCATKHAAKLAVLSTLADTLAIGCRFVDNGDGTATDYDTGLQWEQKTDDDGIHDRDNQYEWSWGLCGNTNYVYPDGPLFILFLAGLNNCSDTATGFAGHCDWRIPTRAELLGTVQFGFPMCQASDGACYDQAFFGPAPEVPNYWSSESFAPDDVTFDHAYGVGFSFGSLFGASKHLAEYARAVRSAL